LIVGISLNKWRFSVTSVHPKEKAVNVIKFNARALKIFSGKLAIEASYNVTTKTVRTSRLPYLIFKLLAANC
jgi:hypothetical protein